MARIFLDANESRNGFLANNDTVFGSTGTETVTINTGATNVRIEGTVEGVALANAPSTYTFLAQGNNLVVFNGGVEVARIIVQDDANGTSLTFPGGQTEVRVGAGGMTIGGAAVPTGTAGPVVPGNLNPNTELATALAAITTAETALSDFLESTVTNEEVAAELPPLAPGASYSDADISAAIDAAVVDAAQDVEDAIQVEIPTADFVGASANVQSALIADARADAQRDITAAQRVLTAAEGELNAGVLSALNTVDSRIAAAESAMDAYRTADRLEDGELARFNVVNDETLTTNEGPGTPGMGAPATQVFLDGVLVATVNPANGQVVIEQNADLSGVTGFDAYIATLQAEANAFVAMNQARTALETAVANVVAVEQGDSSIGFKDLDSDVISSTVDAQGNTQITVNFNASTGAPVSPTVTTTQGDGVTSTEVANVTFQGLAAGQSVTVDGLTLTAGGATPVDPDDVASFFANGTIPLDASVAGTYSGSFIAGLVGVSTVQYTSVTPNQNVPDIQVSGPATANTTQGDSSVATETSSVAFTALSAGQSVTVEGLMLTATGAMSADDVAAAFASLAGGAPVAPADGSFTGTYSGDFTVVRTGFDTVEFTSTTPNTNVADLSVTVAGGSETAPEAQAVLAARAALLVQQAQLVALNEAVAEYQALTQIEAQRDDLADAITDARDAVENSVADGGLGVDILMGAENFTSGDDVYLFNEDTSDTQTLFGFGAQGEDRIFLADDYALVTLSDAWNATANTGNVNVREIFVEQSGNNVILHIENEAFAGNAASNADLTTVTLVGVQADQLTLSDNFLSSMGSIA
ncbi:hypothetical protein ABVV53_15645 [Novosphingobium sp. RD2P27]|uniref:Uncharacterized protein n=1 Tax=Novosphingobium kalidii TaxID=3230299 RepID=A0ABV2D4T5_9SPHN